jgi:hypothetical protein
MNCKPYTSLQATPDFANFEFSSPTLSEPIVRQVKFLSQQGGQSYLVEFRNKPTGKKDDPGWPETKDFLQVIATTIEIIEIYSERYPRRILRFCADSRQKRLVFGTILKGFKELLSPLFLVEAQNPAIFAVEDSARPASFQLSRKAMPYLTVNTVQSTWHGMSRIFDQQFSVAMDKTIRIGMTMPLI